MRIGRGDCKESRSVPAGERPGHPQGRDQPLSSSLPDRVSSSRYRLPRWVMCTSRAPRSRESLLTVRGAVCGCVGTAACASGRGEGFRIGCSARIDGGGSDVVVQAAQGQAQGRQAARTGIGQRLVTGDLHRCLQGVAPGGGGRRRALAKRKENSHDYVLMSPLKLLPI